MRVHEVDLRGRKTTRGRKSNKRRGRRLDVKSKPSGSSAGSWLGRVLVILFVVAGVGLLGMLGARALGQSLFSHNPRFAIRRLTIKGGEIVTPALVREYTGLSEGMNLFEFSIRDVRHRFLRSQPNVRSMTIRRQFPDALDVEISERVPLAAVGQSTSLASDRQGFIFRLRSDAKLPCIVGYSGKVRPGGRLEGLAVAALQVIDACGDLRPGLQLRGIGVKDPEHLVLFPPQGHKIKYVTLKWPDMGEESSASRRQLMAKLESIGQALNSGNHGQFDWLDATHAGRIYGRQ